MKYTINRVDDQTFGQFYQFAKEFVANEFTAYPPEIRQFYLKTDFDQKKLRKNILAKETSVFVAQAKGLVIGFLMVFDYRGGGVNFWWLGVAKNYRNQGVGSALLQAGEEYAVSKKCHFILLYTESQVNIDYYSKRGFEMVGMHKKAWCGQDEYLMQKNLGEPCPESW